MQLMIGLNKLKKAPMEKVIGSFFAYKKLETETKCNASYFSVDGIKYSISNHFLKIMMKFNSSYFQ